MIALWDCLHYTASLVNKCSCFRCPLNSFHGGRDKISLFPDTNAQDSIASQVRSLALYLVHKNNIVKRLAMASSVQFGRGKQLTSCPTT